MILQVRFRVQWDLCHATVPGLASGTFKVDAREAFLRQMSAVSDFCGVSIECYDVYGVWVAN